MYRRDDGKNRQEVYDDVGKIKNLNRYHGAYLYGFAHYFGYNDDRLSEHARGYAGIRGKHFLGKCR